VHEAGAGIVAEAQEADRPGGRLERHRIVVGHGDVEGRAVQKLGAQRATHGAAVRRTAIGRADDERLAEPIANGLQFVESIFADPQRSGAAAGDLGRREVSPAPAGRRTSRQ
jgi:hypothetical protein